MIFLFLSTPILAATEDDYLKAIEIETEKLSVKPESAADEPRAVSQEKPSQKATPRAQEFSSGLSGDAFEKELQARYAGSAVFYKKLPLSDQTEVYEMYRSGAAIGQIRKKIMDRFLKR